MAEEQTVDLGFRMRAWQRAAAEAMVRFTVLVVHRRGGKTVLAVMKLIHEALLLGLADGRYGYVAPTHKQAKDVAWTYLVGYAEKIPGARINNGETWVELPNRAGSVSRIRIYGADDPDALRGVYYDGIVMDEVADMKRQVWGEIIRPALADRAGWALFIGTPKGINLFSELYYRALSTAGWSGLLLNVYQTDALTPAEIEQARSEMTENQFAQEFLCDFGASNDNSLITITETEDACRRQIGPERYDFAARTLGVDVARQGPDRSVIIRRQGLACWKPAKFRGLSAVELAGHVAAEINIWRPDAVFIDGSGGYGAGVIDVLRSLNHSVVEVQFGSAAMDPRFLNKRTEMWWLMAEWLKSGGCIPDDSELKQELASPTYKFNATGRLCLESKEDVKERLSASPDAADALACTFAYPVMASMARRHGVAELPVQGMEYDPWERDQLQMQGGSSSPGLDYDPFAR